MARYVVTVRAGFEAAHALHRYRGLPEAVHGHSWRVEAQLATTTLDEDGLAYDFCEVQKALLAVLGPLDHRCLNEVPPFDQVSPTAEAVAQWVYEELRNRLPGAPLVSVTVFEGPENSVTYFPSEV
jgi:6-pyruvoyltetrahydropterin/6-carboxytetrahydropterin synthase